MIYVRLDKISDQTDLVRALHAKGYRYMAYGDGDQTADQMIARWMSVETRGDGTSRYPYVGMWGKRQLSGYHTVDEIAQCHRTEPCIATNSARHFLTLCPVVQPVVPS